MDYLTTEQAAIHSNFSRRTLETWRVNGKGPAYLKIGSAVRYIKNDLDKWLADHRMLSTSQHTTTNTI